MDLSKIHELYSTLHLIFHRNKNQHGNTRWWKWLSMLRRLVLRLLLALESDGKGDKVAALANHLQRHLVPRCYVEFSTIVTDGQFSPLGTVLLALTARLRKAIFIAESQQISSFDWRRSLSDDRRTKQADLGDSFSQRNDEPAHLPISVLLPVATHTDIRKRREDKFEMPHKHEVPQPDLRNGFKRRRNPIDDLFDGLA
ncbi:hypothetical protein Egran_00961 [Elaphomyces granulatus]|uniref:RNase MRP protein 1 RNA binding domain-containing protein n=1 Tax=Elaphomyces granulatus TaxID=519963 RepID=A0A232M4G8_9EURO|nr:hypothetical protein Egran_00961 [Elaphomyces granulatus]